MNTSRFATIFCIVIATISQGKGSKLRDRVAVLEKDIITVSKEVAAVRIKVEKCAGVESSKSGDASSRKIPPKKMKGRIILLEEELAYLRIESAYFSKYASTLSHYDERPRTDVLKRKISTFMKIKNEYREYRDWKRSNTVIGARSVSRGRINTSFSNPDPPDPEVNKYVAKLKS